MCFVRKCSMFLRSILLTKKFLTLSQVTLYLSYEVLLSIGKNDFENIKWLLTMEYDDQMALSHLFFKVLHNTSCSCIWEIFFPTRESNINAPKEYFKNYQPSQNISIGENGILNKVLTLWNKLLHFFWRMETKIKLLIYVQTLLKVGKKEFPLVTFFINPSNRINNSTQLVFTLKKFIICNSKEANCHMVLIIVFFHFPFLHFSKCPWKVTCSNSTIKSIQLMNSVSQTSIIVS